MHRKRSSSASTKQVPEFSTGKIAGKVDLVHDRFESDCSFDTLTGALLQIFGEAITERHIHNEPPELTI